MSATLGEITSQIVELLTPFDAEQQRRAVSAAMMLLGNSAVPLESEATDNRVAKKADSGGQKREGTINVVTATLGAESCRQILMAAAVHFSLFQGKEKWTREEWSQLAAASRDWKSGYINGISRDVGRMIKAGEIIENARNVFSLSSASLAAARQKFPS